MQTQAFNDAASREVMHVFRQALDPVLARMNQDYRVHHMEIFRKDHPEREEVEIRIILRHPKDFGREPGEAHYVKAIRHSST